MSARWKYAVQALHEISEAAETSLLPVIGFELLSLSLLEKCCVTENVGMTVRLQKGPSSKHYINSSLNRVWVNMPADGGQQDDGLPRHRISDIRRMTTLGERLDKPCSIFSSLAFGELTEYLIIHRGAFSNASSVAKDRLEFVDEWVSKISDWLPRGLQSRTNNNKKQCLASIYFNCIDKKLERLGYKGTWTGRESKKGKKAKDILLAFLDMFPGEFFPQFTYREMSKTNSNENDTLILFKLEGRDRERLTESLEALSGMQEKRNRDMRLQYPAVEEDQWPEIQKASNALALSWLDTFIANQLHVIHRIQSVPIVDDEPQANDITLHPVAGLHRLPDHTLRRNEGGQRQDMDLRPEDFESVVEPERFGLVEQDMDMIRHRLQEWLAHRRDNDPNRGGNDEAPREGDGEEQDVNPPENREENDGAPSEGDEEERDVNPPVDIRQQQEEMRDDRPDPRILAPLLDDDFDFVINGEEF